MSITTKDRNTVGDHVRRIRGRAEMTLRQFSAATGLSESFLSQFERGHTQASVGSLRRIAEALQISLSELFDPNGMSAARVVRPGARLRMPFGDGATKYLISPQSSRDFAVYMARLEVGGSSGPEQYVHDSSDEFLLVLQGSIKLELADTVYLLEPGDGITFRSDVPHRVVNVHDGPSELIWINGAAGI
jgi:transcriptional regulator with XRE-family HTH domain